MNKRNLFMAGLLLSVVFISACMAITNVGNIGGVRGSGNVITETYQVSGFDRITLESFGEVTITQGDQESLEIEAEDNILALLDARVENGVLVLGTKPGANIGSINATRPVRFRVGMKDVSGLTISGSGKIASEAIQASSLDIVLSGSGELDLPSITADSVTATTSGSGSSKLAGKTGDLRITLSGSGSYDAGDLESGTVNVTIPGSGSATVWATDALNVIISGSGSVSYYGSPQMTQDISGSGGVRSLGDH